MELLTDSREILAYAVLPALSGIGFFGTFYSAIKHGLFKSLSDVATGKSEIGPITRYKVNTKWTGIRAIDSYLAFYIAYFLPNPNQLPAFGLQGRHFIGQYAPMWALMMLQSQRKESSALIQARYVGEVVQDLY